MVAPFKWVVVADSESPEMGQVAVDDARYSQVIDVYLRKNQPLAYWQITGEILGYPIYCLNSFINNVGSFEFFHVPPRRVTGLSRKLPWQHPNLPWLWATQLSNIKGRAWDSKRWDPISQQPFSQYQVLRMTILYTVPPYPVLSDSQVGNWPGAEFYRYTETAELEIATEAITRKGIQWKFVRGQGGRPPRVSVQNPIFGGNNTFDAVLPADIGITKRLVKAVFKYKWRHVPAFGFLGRNGFGLPYNIAKCMGTVNAEVWPPRPPAFTLLGSLPVSECSNGTMLMLNPKVTKENACVPATQMWSDLARRPTPAILNYLPPRTVSVEFTMVYFDPPYDPLFQDNRGRPYRGHNLAPLPAANVDQAQTAAWYLLSNSTRRSVIGGVNVANPDPADIYRLYQSTDFTDAWVLNY